MIILKQNTAYELLYFYTKRALTKARALLVLKLCRVPTSDEHRLSQFSACAIKDCFVPFAKAPGTTAVSLCSPARLALQQVDPVNTCLRFFISPVPRPAIQGPEFLQGSALRCNSRFYIPERFLFLSALQAHYHLVLEPGFLFLQTP